MKGICENCQAKSTIHDFCGALRLNCGIPECDFVLQQQLTSYQTEKNRLSLTLEERTEQERAEQSKTLERLEQELVIREKAEAAAAEAERERSVLAVDLKDLQQKLERLTQEYNALQDKVRFVGKRTKYIYRCGLGCSK